MNFVQLSNLVHDKTSAAMFLRQRGVLHNPRICVNCNLPMNMELRDKGDRWRCNIQRCHAEVGLRQDTWLSDSKLSYQKIVFSSTHGLEK